MRYVFCIVFALLLFACGGPGIGQQGHVQSPATDVAVATSEAGFDALMRAVAVKDNAAVGALALSGDVFTVPNGTAVLVLARQSTKVQVRLLDGPRPGVIGWVIAEYVKS